MAAPQVTDLQLGKFLQIAFSEGIRSQLSQDYRDWEYVKQQRVGDPDGRQLNFMFQRSFGPAGVQFRSPTSRKFPKAQSITTSEHQAVYKELDATVEIDYSLWNRARKTPKKYAEPLAMEIQSKTIASKRLLAAVFYGDGTGVIGQAASVVDTTGAGGYATVTLSSSNSARGHVGFFEFGDLLLNYNPAGTADNPTVSGTFYAWRVKSKDRRNNKVVLEAVDEDGEVLDLTASSIDANDVFYRIGQETIADLTGSIADYGSATEVIAGLESLTANDGRTIWDIDMEGSAAGTVIDCGGNAIDVSYLQQVMDDLKINCGREVYKWKRVTCAPETNAAFIESREDDRRFQTVDDNKRGVKMFAYVHEHDVLELGTSEYCPKKRLYILPEGKAGNKVLEFHGTDFEPVSANGSDKFMLKPADDGGHERKITSYMEALGTLICKHPAAIGRLENFTA